MPLPIIPGFTLSSRVGGGAFAHVYTGIRKPGRAGVTRAVAVKILKAEHLGDDWVMQCFRREMEIGSTVRHPSLIAIETKAPDHVPPYHVSTAIAGHTLKAAGPLPVATAMTVIRQIAGALAAMHQKGFVHGDVKPGNIMLGASSRAVLIDLGFARQPGSLAFREGIPGTPNYLAPELCRRTFLDTPAADVFSLGVTAFELLTGTLPFPSLYSTSAVLEQHRDERPRSLQATPRRWPPGLVELVDRTLIADIFERPKANRVAEELRAIRKATRTAA